MAYDSVFKGSEVDERTAAMRPGGTTGQALVKTSNIDFDTQWDDVTGSGGGTLKDYFEFTPIASALVPINSMFVDSADNELKFKTSTGVVLFIGLATS